MNLVYRFFSFFFFLVLLFAFLWGGKYFWLGWVSWDIDVQHQKKGGKGKDLLF
jgi:sensor domain CHASE-containing protein